MSTPNIIIYVSDNLRTTNLSCYGYGRETSPNVDRLAADAVRLETLRRELDEWLWRCGKREAVSETTKLDDLTEEQLRELGYLD